jgi:hypothetical protein
MYARGECVSLVINLLLSMPAIWINYTSWCRISHIMMFNPKNKKIFKRAWAVMAVIIIISMILLYAPIFR